MSRLLAVQAFVGQFRCAPFDQVAAIEEWFSQRHEGTKLERRQLARKSGRK